MNYLGNQIEALNLYSKDAVCWLGVKLKGRYNSVRNANGYKCIDSSCHFCTNTIKRSGLDPTFCDLFSMDDIKELIIASPNRLMEIWTEKSTQYMGQNKSIQDFKDECCKLFIYSGYTDWFLKEKNNYLLAEYLNQHTCNYCNREYIFVYKRSGRGKGMVPQFDHWFSKTDYPLLALSFYNLIPSCATCNTIKGTSPLNLTEHLHPYVDTDIASSYSFSFLQLSINKSQIIFKNNSLLRKKGIDTVKALNLELIYQGHADKELQDLIDLRYKYSTNYLNILLEKTFPDIEISKEERYRLIFGIEIEAESYHKRIFSKFKNDIISELLSIN